MSTFEQDLAAFRAHVVEMKKLGYIHVSAKASANREFHVEGTAETVSVSEKAPAVGGGIGFHSEDDYEDD